MSQLNYKRCPGCGASEGFTLRYWRGKGYGYAFTHKACGWRAPSAKSLNEAARLCDAELERLSDRGPEKGKTQEAAA